MNESRPCGLDPTVVDVADREADSAGHDRAWAECGHRYLVRVDRVRSVQWQGRAMSLRQVVDAIPPTFEPVPNEPGRPHRFTIRAGTGRISATRPTVVLHRPAKKTRAGGKTAGGHKE